MVKYAAKTDVSVSSTKAEIEDLLTKFGCDRFASVNEPQRSAIMFERRGLRYRVMLPLTRPEDHLKNVAGIPLGSVQARQAFDLETRRRWRSLLLVLKSKLVAVEDGISSLEEEFLANVVLPDGDTLGERIIPEVREVARTGKLPPLVGGLPPSKVIALGSRSSG